MTLQVSKLRSLTYAGVSRSAVLAGPTTEAWGPFRVNLTARSIPFLSAISTATHHGMRPPRGLCRDPRSRYRMAWSVPFHMGGTGPQRDDAVFSAEPLLSQQSVWIRPAEPGDQRDAPFRPKAMVTHRPRASWGSILVMDPSPRSSKNPTLHELESIFTIELSQNNHVQSS